MDNRFLPTYDNIRKIWSYLGSLQKRTSVTETSLDSLQTQVDNMIMPAQADSTATTVAELVTDFNNLLAKLRAAGYMET